MAHHNFSAIEEGPLPFYRTAAQRRGPVACPVTVPAANFWRGLPCFRCGAVRPLRTCSSTVFFAPFLSLGLGVAEDHQQDAVTSRSARDGNTASSPAQAQRRIKSRGRPNEAGAPRRPLPRSRTPVCAKGHTLTSHSLVHQKF